MTCTYCVDEVREKRRREVDPQFRSIAATAEGSISELADLLGRAAAAHEAVLGALSKLRTPPAGTSERTAFADVLAAALACGLTLREIGTQMNLSGERIRQIVAERDLRQEP